MTRPNESSARPSPPRTGRMYFAWSGPGRGMGGPAQIYLQLMNTPWSTTGPQVALPADGAKALAVHASGPVKPRGLLVGALPCHTFDDWEPRAGRASMLCPVRVPG